MQEGIMEQLKIDASEVRCLNNNKAKLLCTNSKCKESGILCLLQQCSCQLMHQNCGTFKFDSLVKKLQKKRRPITANISEAFKIMERIYDQAIERISKDKQLIRDKAEYFGLSEDDTTFTKYINDKCYQQINGVLVSKLIENLDIQFQFNAEHDDLTRYWAQKKPELDQILRRFQRLTKKKNKKLESKITDQTEVIDSFFTNFVSEYTLLYRASENNFSAQKFRQACNGKKDTLIIARTQHGRVIGAYASGQWQAYTTAYVHDYQRKNFLFSVNLKEKYPCMSPQHGMYNNPNYGPTFGGGHDFYISDNSSTAENASYCKIGHSYNLNGKYISNQVGSYADFSGATTTHFVKFTEWEVFQLQFL